MTETQDAAPNPLAADLSEGLTPQPCSLVIFGGGGDLSKRKLLPALYNLKLDGLLPTSFVVIGSSRTERSDEEFRNFAREGVEEHSRRALDPVEWRDLEPTLFYVGGSYTDQSLFDALVERLETVETELGLTGNRVFYLSIPPSGIEPCISNLHRAGLIHPPSRDLPFSRVIVEKPIGKDLASAREINKAVSRVLDESQVFRIDHYLGKETVQNILVMRFANSIFEPLWNQRYVDHVQITVAEEEGVGGRAGYYDESGALRDMVQNHLLQLLCLTAMEPPWSLSANVIRDHKLEVLQCLRPIADDQVDQQVIRAQYGPGAHRGNDVPGYRREEGVEPESITETYVALKVHVDNWRWAGVPFYVRTGKRLPKRASEIAVHFREVPPILFNTDLDSPLEPTVLTLRIQPDEGLSLRISTKLPGPRVRIYPVKMDFQYGETFGGDSPEAYERLLLDVMAGDATHFMRQDEVEVSWMWIQHILDRWNESGSRWIPEYAAGSWGPIEADRMIDADSREWRTL